MTLSFLFVFLFNHLFSLAPSSQIDDVFSSQTSFISSDTLSDFSLNIDEYLYPHSKTHPDMLIDIPLDILDFQEDSSSEEESQEIPYTLIDMPFDIFNSPEELSNPDTPQDTPSLIGKMIQRVSLAVTYLKEEILATTWGSAALPIGLFSTTLHIAGIALYDTNIAISMTCTYLVYFSFCFLASPHVRYYIHVLSLLLKIISSPTIFFASLATGGIIGITCWLLNKVAPCFSKKNKQRPLISKQLRQTLQSLGFGIADLSFKVASPEWFYPQGKTRSEVLDKYAPFLNQTNDSFCEQSIVNCNQSFDSQMMIGTHHSPQNQPVINLQTLIPSEQLEHVDILELEIRQAPTHHTCHIQITHGDADQYIVLGDLIPFLDQLTPTVKAHPQRPFSILMTWGDGNSDIDWKCLYQTVQNSTLSPHYFPYSLQIGLTIPNQISSSVFSDCLIQYPVFQPEINSHNLLEIYYFARFQIDTHIPSFLTIESLFTKGVPSFLQQNFTSLFFSKTNCGSMHFHTELCPPFDFLDYPSIEPWPIPCSSLIRFFTHSSSDFHITPDEPILRLIYLSLTHSTYFNFIPSSFNQSEYNLTLSLTPQILHLSVHHILLQGMNYLLYPLLEYQDNLGELFNLASLYRNLPYLKFDDVDNLQTALYNQVKQQVSEHHLLTLNDVASKGYTVILGVINSYQTDFDYRRAETFLSLLKKLYHSRPDIYSYSENALSAKNYFYSEFHSDRFQFNSFPSLLNRSLDILRKPLPNVTYDDGGFNVIRNRSNAFFDSFAPFIQRERIVPIEPFNRSWESLPELNIFMSPSSWGSPYAPLFKLFDYEIFQAKDLFTAEVVFPILEIPLIQGVGYSNVVNVFPAFHLWSWFVITSSLINTRLIDYIEHHIGNSSLSEGHIIFINHVSFSHATEIVFCFNFAEKGQLFASFCQLPSLAQERVFILTRLFFSNIFLPPFKPVSCFSRKFFGCSRQKDELRLEDNSLCPRNVNNTPVLKQVRIHSFQMDELQRMNTYMRSA